VKKKISILTPCYNEQENVVPLYETIARIMGSIDGYDYEHIYIDNASTDGTVAKLRELAAKDKRVKVILNARNFGHIRSPYYGLLQADGEAVVYMASDFQDPPDLIPKLIDGWQRGAKAVLAIKDTSDESGLFFALRRFYYRVVERLAVFMTAPLLTTASRLRTHTPIFAALLRRPDFRPRRSTITSRPVKGVSRRTTFTPFTTWRCWASPIIPRFRCGWPPCRVF
jgi:glycosyltransferase involved in cell wall biosynthesis